MGTGGTLLGVGSSGLWGGVALPTTPLMRRYERVLSELRGHWGPPQSLPHPLSAPHHDGTQGSRVSLKVVMEEFYYKGGTLTATSSPHPPSNRSQKGIEQNVVTSHLALLVSPP